MIIPAQHGYVRFVLAPVNSLKVDEAEKGIDVIFLHFFVLEFVLRVIALGGVDMSWTAFFCQVEIG